MRCMCALRACSACVRACMLCAHCMGAWLGALCALCALRAARSTRCVHCVRACSAYVQCYAVLCGAVQALRALCAERCVRALRACFTCVFYLWACGRVGGCACMRVRQRLGHAGRAGRACGAVCEWQCACSCARMRVPRTCVRCVGCAHACAAHVSADTHMSERVWGVAPLPMCVLPLSRTHVHFSFTCQARLRY